MTTDNKYEKKAEEFLEKTGTKFKSVFLRRGTMPLWNDKQERDIYELSLERNKRIFKTEFGQSLDCSGKWIVWDVAGGRKITQDERPSGLCSEIERNADFKEPDAYSLLACLQKTDVGSFSDFCADFGYSDDSIKAKKIYDALVREYGDLQRLFSDSELEEMQEIA